MAMRFAMEPPEVKFPIVVSGYPKIDDIHWINWFSIVTPPGEAKYIPEYSLLIATIKSAKEELNIPPPGI